MVANFHLNYPNNMNKFPLVSIYIPCRNYGRYLSQSVESVINQIYKNWELFIIDEGSEDNTFEIANKYKSDNPSQISVIKNNSPLGLQKLSNHILSMANGKYMMRLDADDWLDEMAILAMVAKLEETPDIGIVYGNYFYVDSEGKFIDMEFRHKFGVEDIAGHLPPHGACTMFSTRALKNAGGYSEAVDAQDGWDLWYKLLNRIGAASINIPTFYYRQHANSMSLDNERLLNARNTIFANINASLEGDYSLTTVAIIPVRESYENFKNVPYQEINGKSLLEMAINSAVNSNKINAVVVSSESQKVLDFSNLLEAQGKVPKHLRMKRSEGPKDERSIPIQDFMIEAGEYYKEVSGINPDVITFLSLHAVFRNSDHIDTALNVLRVTESDSVVSVNEEREPMFSHGVNGLNLLNPGRFKELIFDRERIYRFNGSIIATWWEVLKLKSIFGEKIGYIEMSLEKSFQVKSKKMLDYVICIKKNDK